MKSKHRFQWKIVLGKVVFVKAHKLISIVISIVASSVQAQKNDIYKF